MKTAEEIIIEGLGSGLSYAEVNEQLAKAGYPIRLVDRSDSGWTDSEMNAGFSDNESPSKILTLSMMTKRHEELAGTEREYHLDEGIYKIKYDENGYFRRAVRL